jgi:geranylgeranyl pyrophosphate synthase
MDLPIEMKRLAARVEAGIEAALPPDTAEPTRLSQAMRYSMRAGGKRLRPVLVLAAAELFDPSGAIDPVPAAVAVECIHTYSLIHDDLPCMDDDDLRRGRPTLHKAFDEATAVLAGDALLTLAFQLLARRYGAHPALAVALIRELSEAAGHAHLVGGQMLDLIHEHATDLSAATLEAIHAGKTGGMIWASLVLGGRLGGAAEPQIEGLRTAGRALGMAFQIMDDVLDATSDRTALGKTPGKDAQADKATFVKVHGLDESRRIARRYSDEAIAAFQCLPGDAAFLSALADSLASRGK